MFLIGIERCYRLSLDESISSGIIRVFVWSINTKVNTTVDDDPALCSLTDLDYQTTYSREIPLRSIDAIRQSDLIDAAHRLLHTSRLPDRVHGPHSNGDDDLISCSIVGLYDPYTISGALSERFDISYRSIKRSAYTRVSIYAC